MTFSLKLTIGNIEWKINVYCFCGLIKSIQQHSWNKMFDILYKTGLKFENREVIYNLYKKRAAVVKIDKGKISKMCKGVSQGCSVQLIFSTYICI